MIENLPTIASYSPLGSVGRRLENFDHYVDVWINVDGVIFELGKHQGSKLKNDLASKLKVINEFDPKTFKLFDAWQLDIQSTKQQYVNLLEALNASRKADIAVLVDFPEDNSVPFALYNLFVGECKHDFVFDKLLNSAYNLLSLTVYSDNTSHIKQFRHPVHTKHNEMKRLSNMFCTLVDAQNKYFDDQNSRKVSKIQLTPKVL